MYLETYELDPARILTSPELAWQAAIKNTKVKSDLLTHTDMLLMTQKDIRGILFRTVYRYVKANSKYMKKL